MMDAKAHRAREIMTASVYEAWVRMGRQVCAQCGRPLVPCPKGPGSDEPGFCGFCMCPCESARRLTQEGQAMGLYDC